uniref:Uncharacterized protein n=1 Tax=Aegilops tauschii subsp. strangulata TaxID=200361 RepID=A0A453N8M2_AEGTS
GETLAGEVGSGASGEVSYLSVSLGPEIYLYPMV